MKLIRVEEIKGGEILARQILTEDNQILLGEGILLKKEYVDKFIELGVHEVYIKKDIEAEEESILLEEKVKEECLITIKNVLEKHTYYGSSKLAAINSAAEEVMENILKDNRVVDKVIEIKERSTDLYEHSLSVSSLAILIALKLNLSNDSIHDIGLIGLLHDLGLRYVTIPINQDVKMLNKKDQKEYKKHTIYGYTAIAKEDWISERAKNILLYHHERLDRSGYPLRASEISIESQIVGVCEVFDEFLCGIGCKRMKVHEAIEYLKAINGTCFDSKIIDTLLTFAAVFPANTMVKLSDGSQGVVIRQSEGFPDRPVIRLTCDKAGNPCIGEIVDLIKIHNLVVEEVMD